jgi:hypothetical protein
MEYSPILKYEEKATSQQVNMPLGIKYKKHRYDVPYSGLGTLVGTALLRLNAKIPVKNFIDRIFFDIIESTTKAFSNLEFFF